VSALLVCIGSPCLRHRLHGASMQGGAARPPHRPRRTQLPGCASARAAALARVCGGGERGRERHTAPALAERQPAPARH
jgi:hypothetical protein